SAALVVAGIFAWRAFAGESSPAIPAASPIAPAPATVVSPPDAEVLPVEAVDAAVATPMAIEQPPAAQPVTRKRKHEVKPPPPPPAGSDRPTFKDPDTLLPR